MVNERDVLQYFAAELTERMRRAEISDRDLSEYCQISEVNLPGYRSGKHLPNPWYLVLIAERLECTVNDLLGFETHDELLYPNSPYASDAFSARNRFEVYFGYRLAQCMNVKNIGVVALSYDSGLSVSRINRWLSDRPSLIQTPDLLRLADALDCTPSDLLGY